MSNNRIFVEGPVGAGSAYTIEGDQARYISRVRRLRRGDALVLFDGRDMEFPAVITSSTKDTVQVDVGERVERSAESPLAITLLQGLSRGDRMDYVIQKATELGVARICPVSTEFSVVKLDSHRAQARVRHWRGIAASACEQCGRNRLPEVDAPEKLVNVLGGWRESPAAKILLQPDTKRSLRTIDVGNRELTVLIGPEGGFSAAELENAATAGFQAAGIGPRILRTETAAVAALSALQTLYGDLA